MDLHRGRTGSAPTFAHHAPGSMMPQRGAKLMRCYRAQPDGSDANRDCVATKES